MEFKGTNGWFLDKEGYLKDKNLDIIADFFITNQEDLANAKLASKALEMLEMLKLLIDRLDENNLSDLSATKRAKQLIKEATEL